jgi:hypothetical protein
VDDGSSPSFIMTILLMLMLYAYSFSMLVCTFGSKRRNGRILFFVGLVDGRQNRCCGRASGQGARSTRGLPDGCPILFLTVGHCARVLCFASTDS